MPQNKPLKKGDVIKLDAPKICLTHRIVNGAWQHTIQPKFALLVVGFECYYTIFKVAKMQLKKDRLKHGTLIRISNDSLINLQFKKL